MRSVSRVSVVLATVPAVVTAHSWIDCFDTNHTKIYDQSASYIYGGSGGNGFCDGYGAGYPGRGDTDIGTEYTFKMLENEVEAGTPVCQTVAADTYTSTDWRKRISVAPGETVYFAYLPNGHIVKDKKAIGTQHGVYWTGQADTKLTSTLDMTHENLMDGYTMDFDDGNCGESYDYDGNPGGRAVTASPASARSWFRQARQQASTAWSGTGRSGWTTRRRTWISPKLAGTLARPTRCVSRLKSHPGAEAQTRRNQTPPAPPATTATPTYSPEPATTAPQTTSPAPQSTSAAPEVPTATPISTTATPVATTMAPASTTAAPVTSWDQVDDSSAAGEADPTAITNAPALTTSAPQVTTATPVTITSAPQKATAASVTSTPAPAPTTVAPTITVSDAPVTEPPAQTTASPETPGPGTTSSSSEYPEQTSATLNTSAATSASEPEMSASSDETSTQTPASPETSTSTFTEEPKSKPSSDQSEGGYSTFDATTFSSLGGDEDSVGTVHPASTGSSASGHESSSNDEETTTSSSTSGSASSSASNSSSSGSIEAEVGSESLDTKPEVSYGDSTSRSEASEEEASTSSSSSSSTASASANAEASFSLTASQFQSWMVLIWALASAAVAF